MTSYAADGPHPAGTLALAPLLPTYHPHPVVFFRGAGDELTDLEGRTHLDFYGGHCVCVTGHSHPTVVDAIKRQAGELLFYSTAVQLPVREAAAEALVRFAPASLESVFFCNSGAEANENALKAARLVTGRRRFIAFTGSFHGRTLLALSATDSPRMKRGLEDLLAPVEFLPFGDAEALASADLSDVAALILEPIQSMAGVRTAPASWFAALRTRATQAGALLVFDEIQTGFGRLGSPFAAQHYGVTPDLMTLAKGIASGVPMAAVLMTAAVATRLAPGDMGSTFGGGPLACAALLATLSVIQAEGLMDRARACSARIRDGLAGTAITMVHGEGLLLGLRVPGRAGALKLFLQDRRILVGGSGDPDVLRLMPPLTVRDSSIDALLAAIASFTSES
ncbi:MAG TPA: aminotransferase class III-fold pyridoxal phosphate-dependent enzyme [Vicinamibacterales bacterium]|nr:aminotransferase class III-fold pyridoxal phosphate-dependent enzyme [Vicinamibacterales bacterium]